jgi:predicted nucleic acid-binding protein
MTLVDTNVISDILSGDPNWLDWSAQSLEARAQAGDLLTNDVVYAELSMRMASAEVLDQRLDAMRIRLVRTPRPALFLAGQAFMRYRQSGGIKANVLPDFFIGAHAEIEKIPILTRDVRRYRTYFPAVTLIAP